MRSTPTLWGLGLVALALGACDCGSSPVARCSDQRDCIDSTNKFCAVAKATCVQCLEDAHCEAGSLCDPEGACVPGCRDEVDRCALGTYCLADAGCTECATSAHCGPGRVCTADGRCTPGCSAEHPECPAGQVCDVGAGQCVECTASTDCQNPARPICDGSARRCVECTDGAQCADPARKVCEVSAGVCVGCLTDASCAPGTVCDTTTKTCVTGCSASQPCPVGQVCAPATGQCVGCLADGDCPSPGAPRCDLSRNTCVQCVTAPSDSCPQGQYCRSDGTCEQGCKTGADCPSQQCQVDHSCAGCTSDVECAAGKVCAPGGTCIEACNEKTPCGPGRTCCSGHCVDTGVDRGNCGACNVTCGSSQACCAGACTGLDTQAACGACGISCAAGQGCCGAVCTPLNTLTNCGACGVRCGVDQFCDGTTCRDQTFPEFCANKKVYAILDQQPLDDAATAVLVSTVQSNCSAQTQVFTGPQTTAAWVDQTTGALLLGGGSTVVTAGGPYPNRVVKWLEQTRRATKVYVSSNNVDTWYFRRRADSSVIVSKTKAYCELVPRKDVFMVELVTDPTSGTLVLIAYGLCGGGYGTQTGAWYWANVMLPGRASYPDSWYLVEWADNPTGSAAERDKPDGSDTFTILEHGR